MEKIIGRDDELTRLTEIAGSDRPEFVAVYGRRRVGKTFIAENPDKQWTQVVVITTRGLKRNVHSGVAKKELTLDDLFE